MEPRLRYQHRNFWAVFEKVFSRKKRMVSCCAKRPCQKSPENLCRDRYRGSITRRELFGQSFQGMGFLGATITFSVQRFWASELRAWTYADPGRCSWQRHKCEPWKISRKRARILRALGDFKGLERSNNRYAKFCAPERGWFKQKFIPLWKELL